MHNITVLVHLIILKTGGHTKTVYVTLKKSLKFLHKMCSKCFIAPKHILQVTASHAQDVSKVFTQNVLYICPILTKF